MNWNIRHGPTGGNGTYVGDNGLRVEYTSSGKSHYQTGTFAPNCSAINWTTPADDPKDSLSGLWCRAWTAGCESPDPPYGKTLAFLQTIGDNMVLQRAPAKSAVYGIYGPQATSPKDAKVMVTVTSNDGSSYTVPAEIGTVHQAQGDPNYEGCVECPGPYATWKAFLRPTEAGGNYTITANCTGCGGDPKYWSTSITNVTFGDVWHCSGQSNMWLPLGNTFNRNKTLSAILQGGKYRNMRGMIGNSGNGNSVVSNPWMTALAAAQAVTQPLHSDTGLMDFGAACWYFGQTLVDLAVSAGDLTSNGEPVPLGLINTAIGGQRIEEYQVNDTDSGPTHCGGAPSVWNGRLYAKMIMPFVDMTTKGFVWYQGENNMGGVKGSSTARVGYACNQQALVEGWRKAFSATPGTTDPLAPFGIVTLASSGSEGGPNMGAMRQAQTASYGILPNPAMPNTFLAQAYDLDDEWGPGAGPCTGGGYEPGPVWACCQFKCQSCAPYNKTSCDAGTGGRPEICDNACNAALDTEYKMGGIHPRSKLQVGTRLATAYYNTIGGGSKTAFTGPTLSGCSVGAGSDSDTLHIAFNSSLLRGDKLKINPWGTPVTPPVRHAQPIGGSFLFVQTNASQFCMEVEGVENKTSGQPIPDMQTCPTWAGGDGQPVSSDSDLDGGWIRLNFTADNDGTGINVDLSPLNGTAPTAVRYAWGIVNCCDENDPNLYVTHGCIADCPIYSARDGLPANPFKAKIVDGKCECIAPQVCS